MKFPMYKKETKDNGYHNDPFRAVNFNVDADGDLVCPGGKKFHFAYRKAVRGNQYGRQEEYYTCEDCSGCPYKSDCIKGNNCKTPLEERTKTLQAAKTFLKYREEDLERILSEEGILLRINRNIQVEGSFGDIKQDMQFRRYLRKGRANVLAESILLAMARNINKLHNKIQKGRTGTHLFPLKSA